MSRRRGEFEHRTSIFEGAFRAWSYLGGIDPLDLEAKTLTELDPLNSSAEERAKNDPRLSSAEYKKQEEGEQIGRRIYPYEPLPRSGLAHPFVQAVLSPWLGPEAEQNAIQLGLTTLRTWWQHRRKGESGSAVAALGTEKMRGVVEGYTRHFFSLAYCLVTNDGEQPPRTLYTKMKGLEKQRSKKNKRKAREEEAGKLAALALNAGLAHGLSLDRGNPASADSSGPGTPTPNDLFMAHQQPSLMPGLLNITGFGAASAPTANGEEQLTSLEQFALKQSQLHPESRPSMTNQLCVPGKLNLQHLALQMQAQGARNLYFGGLYGGNLNTDILSSGNFRVPVSETNKGVNATSPAALGSQDHAVSDPTETNDRVEELPNSKTPIVLISPKGDIQIAMIVQGITCAHCVKIVETVLKGCSGNKSPIQGLLDAAADHELCSLIIKIDRSSNAKRIAKESARNLAMVGYSAKVMEMTVDLSSSRASGMKIDLGLLNSAFDVVAATDPADVFDWTLPCSCPDNGFARNECRRHSQMNARIFQAFRDRKAQITQYIVGCGKRYGGECTCDPSDCPCSDCSEGCGSKAGLVPAPVPSASCCGSSESDGAVTISACCSSKSNGVVNSQTENLREKDEMVMTSEQISKHLTATAIAAASGRLGNASRNNSLSSTFGRRRLSTQSENTFGRALSGLSALSIDWENMDDFDVNVDHSAHINNDLTGTHAKCGAKAADEDMVEAIMAGCAMMYGGECNCGPTCCCVGCPIHDKGHSSAMHAEISYHYGGGGGVVKRSSLRIKRGVGNEPPQSVSFKM